MNNSGPGAELSDKFGFHEWVNGRKPRKRGGKHFLQAETFNGQDHARCRFSSGDGGRVGYEVLMGGFSGVKVCDWDGLSQVVSCPKSGSL